MTSRRAARRAAVLAATTALALTGLAGCGQSAAPAQAPSTPGTVNVVASTDVYGSIATAIGGDHVHVTSIIHSPDADPHEYESTPNDAVAVGQAKVLIANGGGYDEFAGKLLAASDNGAAQAIDVSKLSGLDTGESFNEHVFYSLPTMAKLADTLVADLGKADPADAASFTANATAFKAQLDGLNTKLATIKAGHNGARIAITEPVALYLTEASGLVNATPEAFAHAVEDGNDPPAAVLQQTLALFQGPDKVSALVLNGQTESAITNQVQQAAESAQVPVIKVTETMPAGTMDYVTWMGGQIDQLGAALGRRQ